jgi:membrane-associated phospholipid phosphatase
VPSARAAALLLALAASPAAAQRPALQGSAPAHLAVTLGAAGLWGGLEALKPTLAPAACRWCQPTALDAWTRGRLRWAEPDGARRASDLLAYAVLPAAAAASALLAARRGGDSWEEGLRDLLVVAEAATLAGAAGQLVKFGVARERPFVRARRLAGGPAVEDPDDLLSFWSGHTAFTVALATAAGTVAAQRGDRAAPWVLGSGLAAAATVGWLRIAADKHWATDVLAGAAVGAAVGWAVPALLHPRVDGAGPAPAARRATLVPLLALGF